MSLTHLAEVFGVAPRRRFDGDFSWPPRPLPNPPLPPQRSAADCAYCGSEIAGQRCQSCGAPRRRSLSERIRAVLPDPGRIEAR